MSSKPKGWKERNGPIKSGEAKIGQNLHWPLGSVATRQPAEFYRTEISISSPLIVACITADF